MIAPVRVSKVEKPSIQFSIGQHEGRPGYRRVTLFPIREVAVNGVPIWLAAVVLVEDVDWTERLQGLCVRPP